jgi:DNA-binding MarR family transcriptional regulator
MKETGVISALLNAWDAYEAVCHPLCKEVGLSKVSFDILMLLADNPELTSAGDVVRLLHLRPNLVSVYVDRLVQDGYLERQAVEGDRRKVRLLCTEQAMPLIQKGHQIQAAFLASLFDGVSAEEQAAFRRTVEQCRKNTEQLIRQARGHGRLEKRQATS